MVSRREDEKIKRSRKRSSHLCPEDACIKKGKIAGVSRTEEGVKEEPVRESEICCSKQGIGRRGSMVKGKNRMLSSRHPREKEDCKKSRPRPLEENLLQRGVQRRRQAGLLRDSQRKENEGRISGDRMTHIV